MRKVVLFDWGGVVSNHENDLRELKEAKIRVIKRFNKDIKSAEVLDFWKDDTDSFTKPIQKQIQYLEKKFNFNASVEKFKKAYVEEYSKISHYQDVVDFAHSLKNVCKIGVLSNLNVLDKQKLDSDFNLKKFDYIFLSFEIGYAKPDSKIFEYALNKMKIEPKNVLFIDDSFKNISAARLLGFRVCHANGLKLDKIKKYVEEFLNDK